MLQFSRLERFLKRLAGILILIFAFNIIAEMTAGHCHEICSGEQPQVQKVSAKASLTSSAKPKSPSEREDAHVCHFGHCSHIAAPTTQVIPVHSVAPLPWIITAENPLWRNLAPPLKPPIV